MGMLVVGCVTDNDNFVLQPAGLNSRPCSTTVERGCDDPQKAQTAIGQCPRQLATNHDIHTWCRFPALHVQSPEREHQSSGSEAELELGSEAHLESVSKSNSRIAALSMRTPNGDNMPNPLSSHTEKSLAS